MNLPGGGTPVSQLLPDRFGYPFEIGKEERMLHVERNPSRNCRRWHISRTGLDYGRIPALEPVWIMEEYRRFGIMKNTGSRTGLDYEEYRL
jgi:hypothetical protein